MPYLALVALMVWGVASGVWWSLLAVPLAAGLLMRVYVIFHDCAHSSFFRSRRANTFVGTVCGVLTFTPFFHWRHVHAVHHATSGDLDRRGVGDISTLSVDEYLALDRWGRARYRMYRSVPVMLGIGPLYLHVLSHRFPDRTSKPRERRSVHLTNAALALQVGVAWWTGLLAEYLVVQLVILALAGLVGIWLFYVQHQFEDAYWQRHDQWDYADAALRGSSHLRMPRVLQWFTGNIGLHHIHHLSSRIPNYRLQRCHDENPALQDVPTLSIRDGLGALSLKLWCEQRGKMIPFSALDPA